MMVDSPDRDHQPFCDLAVLEAFVDQAQHLELARRKPKLVLARRRARPPWEAEHTLLAETAGDDRGRGTSLEAVQFLEGGAQQPFFARFSQRQSRFIRATRVRPQRGRRLGLPGELQSVRSRGVPRPFSAQAGALAPHRQLVRHIGPALGGQLPRQVSRRDDTRCVTGQPRHLGSGRRHGAHPLQLPSRFGQGLGLGEQVPVARVPPPCPHQRQHDQGDNARGYGCTGDPEHRVGHRLRPGPIPPAEGQPGLVGE